MTTSTSSRSGRMLTLGLLLAGLALAAPGFAGDGEEGCTDGCPYHAKHGKHHGPGGWIERHAEELGIDDATLAEIRAIEEGAREDGKTLHEARRAAHADLRELLDQDEPDRDAVMAQVEAIGDLETKQHKQRVTTMLAIRDKLTPEQRAELRELKQEMHGKHHGRHGHHGKMGCEGKAEGEDTEA